MNCSNKGIISTETLSRVYSFVHYDGDAKAPAFDNDADISLLSSDDNSVTFLKEYSHLGDIITLKHTVSDKDDAFYWDIEQLDPFKDPYISCRFGITIPIDSSVYIVDDVIAPPVVNYNQHWHSIYEGQIDIDFPIVRTDSLHIMSPIHHNVQYFSFEHDKQRYLKISTMSDDDMSLSIKIEKREGNMKEAYCKSYASSESFVFRSKAVLAKLERMYGVTISVHQSINTQYKSVVATDSEIEDYVELLEENLSFYPRNICELIGLKQISLCGNITDGEVVIKGWRTARNIMLNISSQLHNIDKAKALHHEIFHMVEDAAPRELMSYEHIRWRGLSAEDAFSKHCGGPLSLTEYRAELFATFVLDPAFIKLLRKDAEFDQKVSSVLSMFSSLGNKCELAIGTHKHLKESPHLIRIQHSSPQQLPFRLDRFVLAGLRHSCLEWMGRCLSVEPLGFVEDLDSIPDSPVVYTTVNPIDYCACEYLKDRTPVEESMKRWVQSHEKIEAMAKSYCFLTENALKHDIGYVSNFFEALGHDFNKERLYEIEDIRRHPLEGIPMLRKIWSVYRRVPIVVRVGYNTMSCED